jgi:DNA polymerase type B, organellar and viral
VNIDLNYIGYIPSPDFFAMGQQAITITERKQYLSYIKERLQTASSCNLKEPAGTFKYCENDCCILLLPSARQDTLVLYKVIENFNKFIFDLFKLNIHSLPTIPSLAFAIFRSIYFKNSYIPLIEN